MSFSVRRWLSSSFKMDSATSGRTAATRSMAAANATVSVDNRDGVYPGIVFFR